MWTPVGVQTYMPVCSKWRGIILRRGTSVHNPYNWDSWYLFSLHALRGGGGCQGSCTVELLYIAGVPPAAKGLHILYTYVDHGCVSG